MAHKILTMEEKQKIIDNYTIKKYGILKSGREAGGFSERVVRRILKEANIPIRTKSEAAVISNIQRRKFNCNDDYFSSENSNMAYLLGFFAADGTVSKDNNTIKLSLSSVDREFLEKVRQELKVEKPIFDYTTNNGYPVSELQFTSAKIKDDFEKYNIVPRKTYNFTFPRNLNRKYWIDFIRGYFDGDGSVSTAGPHAIRWQLCSNQKDVLEVVTNFFEEEYGIPKVNIQVANRGQGRLYYIQYSTNATKEIFKHLYYKDCFYLPRKYEKYKTLI